MTHKKVHFTVDPDWATDFVRTRWGEGEYQWCYEFLESCGVHDFNTAKKIIWGDARFAPVEGNPDVFILADDDWRADPGKHHLCQYPNPFVFSEMREAQERLVKDRAEDLAGLLYADFNEERDWAENRGRVYPYVRSRNFDLASAEFQDFGNRLLQEQFLNEEIANADSVKPSNVFENGIIIPDGNFYRCGVMGHDELASKLGYELDVDQEGLGPAGRAVKDGCFVLSLTLGTKKVRRPKTPTKAQRKTLGEWYNYVSYSDARVMEIDY